MVNNRSIFNNSEAIKLLYKYKLGRIV